MSQVSIIDIEGNHPQIPTQFDANVGFAIPIANVLEILGDTQVAGTTPVHTEGSGNAITTYVQISQAIAAPNSANIGLSAFNSAQFTVDATGFVSLSGAGQAIDSIAVQSGTSPIVPDLNGQVTFNGATVAAGLNPVRSNGTGPNTYALEVQRTQESVTSDANKAGLSSFSAADFNVDGNGFVTTNGNTVNWQLISASQTLEVNTGYFCIAPGGALSLQLPATASRGNIIEVTLDGATSWTITQGGGQQIRYNNAQTTAGVGGSLSSTDQGNSIKMVCQTDLKWNVVSALDTLAWV